MGWGAKGDIERMRGEVEMVPSKGRRWRHESLCSAAGQYAKKELRDGIEEVR